MYFSNVGIILASGIPRSRRICSVIRSRRAFFLILVFVVSDFNFLLDVFHFIAVGIDFYFFLNVFHVFVLFLLLLLLFIAKLPTSHFYGSECLKIR